MTQYLPKVTPPHDIHDPPPPPRHHPSPRTILTHELMSQYVHKATLPPLTILTHKLIRYPSTCPKCSCPLTIMLPPPSTLALLTMRPPLHLPAELTHELMSQYLHKTSLPPPLSHPDNYAPLPPPPTPTIIYPSTFHLNNRDS